MPTAPDEVKNLEIWGHKHPMILLAGRITHLAPPNMTEEEKEEYLGKL